MCNVITVQHLFFRADIYLDHLEGMTLRNFQRLLRIAAKDPQLNEEAVQLLRAYFKRQVLETHTMMQSAVKAYLDGYNYVNCRSRTKQALATRKENKRLRDAFIHAKAHHDKIIKLKDVFLAAFPDDTKH